jgi:cytochrome P450
LPIFSLRYRKITALITGIQRFFEIATQDVQLAIQRRCCSSADSGESTIIEQLLNQDLTLRQVQGELQNIFFAAFDTTTALLANLFDCLARHPRIVKRIQTELALVVADRMLAEADLARLPYLRAAIFETLRLQCCTAPCWGA